MRRRGLRAPKRFLYRATFTFVVIGLLLVAASPHDRVSGQTLGCDTDGAVTDTASKTGLVGDCETLLGERTTLGAGVLNWSSSTAVERLSMLGGLVLNGNRLTEAPPGGPAGRPVPSQGAADETEASQNSGAVEESVEGSSGVPRAVLQDPVATAPGNLSAAVEDGVIKLSWDAPTEDGSSVTGYQILRSHGGLDPSVLRSSASATTTTFSDESADRIGMTYTYQVKAWRDTVLSEASNEASATKPQSCTGSTFNTSPEDVEVSAVPITVTSTTADYFVLLVRPDLDKDLELPILVALGEAGTTTLTEQLSPLAAEHYRIEKYPVDDPGDVDGDCISDVEELAALGRLNPLNHAGEIAIEHGTVAIPDHGTFQQLSYLGGDVQFDPHLADLEFVKFTLYHRKGDRPGVYFLNTQRHRHHHRLRRWVSFPESEEMRGEIIYHRDTPAPDGSLGVYRVQFQPTDNFDIDAVRLAYEVLAASMPFLKDNLAFHPMPGVPLARYHQQKARYDESRINILLQADIVPEVNVIKLNHGIGFGLLRVMELDERPNPREVVIYESLPNDLPKVAGIITTVPQTPLSHVNLRAVQDKIPNAYVRDGLDDRTISSLIGSYVEYRVDRFGYTIGATTKAEVDIHHRNSRPKETQTPERDLTVTAITALSEVEFDDWKAFGVKAANVAVLGTLGFPEGTVPDGFAVPFYFYERFMNETTLGKETVFGKGKGSEEEKFTLAADKTLSEAVEAMLAHSKFQTDFEIQDEMLDDLRDAINDAESPQWVIAALEDMHGEFPEGRSLRYRSSTNNEDLPGFSGAGLYDSKTQDADETENDGIDKSLKAVWASLWNFGAFVERDFHRVDHDATAMGVLVHPNYEDELANGVAVSYDPISRREGAYYINTQLGEDLVTNPEALSVPEEILLFADGSYQVLVHSNQVDQGELLMSDTQLQQLRQHLSTIHDHFKSLYEPDEGERFAMEIEFKITSDDVLAIKQARPWVFTRNNESPAFEGTGAAWRVISEHAQPGTAVGDPVVATDPEGDRLTYSLGGPDAALFAIESTSGQLSLLGHLDYEAKSRLAVTVSVHDGHDVEGEDSAEIDAGIDIVIFLSNEDDPGSLSFQPLPPRVGRSLFSTLSDPDGSPSNDVWAWARSRSPHGPWTPIQGATSREYTPVEADVNHYLRVTLSYDDGHGSGKSATYRSPSTTAADDNSSPTVSIVHPAPAASIGEGEAVALIATASDADGDALSFHWTSNLGGSFANADAKDTVWTAPLVNSPEEAITLTLVVTDARSASASTNVVVTVRKREVSQPAPGGGGGGGGGAPAGPTPSTVDYEWTVKHDIEPLDGDNDTPTGMWSDGGTLWLLDNPDGAGDAVYGYDLETKERVEGREFELDERNRAPRGIWSDGATVWVSDSGQDKLFAYDLETGERLEERNTELADRNADARGIWSDGETMWVLDERRNALFAYDLEERHAPRRVRPRRLQRLPYEVSGPMASRSGCPTPAQALDVCSPTASLPARRWKGQAKEPASNGSGRRTSPG